jgi:hypothetical protein
MSPYPLAGCEEKLKRASFHFEVLDELIFQFFETKPQAYRVVTEIDKESSRYLGRVRISRELPLQWSVVVGDYLQNLRATLDHLIWQLVLANEKKPGFGNSFPIFDKLPPEDPSHPDRERWERHIRGLHPDAARFIDFCQPYKGIHGPGVHTLTGLRILSNEDKHRVLVPALSSVHQDREQFTLRAVEVRDIKPPIPSLQVHAGRPLNDGDLVFQTSINIIGPNPEVKTEGKVPLDVGFGRKPVPMKGLKQMGDLVGIILTEGRRLL